MNEAAGSFGQKRRQAILDLGRIREPNKRQQNGSQTTGQFRQALTSKDDRIKLLQDEVHALEREMQTLRSENEALKLRIAKKHVCELCKKSYNRSDGLYKHLREGDHAHKALAQERYDTTCEICGRDDFKSWIGLQRHLRSDSTFFAGRVQPVKGQSRSLVKHDQLVSTPTGINFTRTDQVRGEGSKRALLHSTNDMQLPKDHTRTVPPSTSFLVTRANRHLFEGTSPGFIDDLGCPLNSAAPGYEIPLAPDMRTQDAPSLATNSSGPLNLFPVGQNDGVITDAPSFALNLPYALNDVAHAETVSARENVRYDDRPSSATNPLGSLGLDSFGQPSMSLYDTTAKDAPSFGINPAHLLNTVAPSQMVPLFHEDGEGSDSVE
ncbi:MAG: hypothetical protein M4579_007012 [Chaenotheca gracillima]|nr:MAG: hypothetical protein M4579_007012 [Chaenotheca gracillima]